MRDEQIHYISDILGWGKCLSSRHRALGSVPSTACKSKHDIVHTLYLSTEEVQARGSEIQGWSQFFNDTKTTLSYMNACPQNKQAKQSYKSYADTAMCKLPSMVLTSSS